MESNILKMINNISLYGSNEIIRNYVGNNRANNEGNALELFVKDAFCNSFGLEDEEAKKKYNEVFSYIGNNKNPPDAIIRNGDAIEVKKNNQSNKVQLNSSYPSKKLNNNSMMINKRCRECEGVNGWTEKDLVYFVGELGNNKLKYLTITYGDCFAANEDVYFSVKNTIKEKVNGIEGFTFEETNELGKINNIDKLSITDLRIRGMWIMDNPRSIFSYVLDEYNNVLSDMNVFLIMQTEKYNSFSSEDRAMVEQNNLLYIHDIRIKNPDNPEDMMDAKLIYYYL